MALDRRLKRLEVDFRRVKYAVRLTSEECEPDTEHSLRTQSLMLEAIQRDPKILACGPARTWTSLTIKHNGTAWVCEAWAEVEEETERR